MITMDNLYRKADSIYKRAFKKNDEEIPEFSPNILRKLTKIGVDSDILINSAMNVGGIANNAILRIYSKMGDEEITQKMQRLIEEDLFKKTVEKIKHFYI